MELDFPQFIEKDGTDVFKHVILNYMSNKDCISLYYADLITKDRLYNIINNSILNNLISLFKKDYPIVLRLLKENEISITGSFVLENILGEKYNGDIDLRS